MKPTIPKKDADEIKHLISEGLLSDVLEKIQSYEGHEFVLLRSRYKDLEGRRRQSTITHEAFQTQKNQLIKDCLAAVEEYTSVENEEPGMADEKEKIDADFFKKAIQLGKLLIKIGKLFEFLILPMIIAPEESEEIIRRFLENLN